jgi:hypothetical protein
MTKLNFSDLCNKFLANVKAIITKDKKSSGMARAHKHTPRQVSNERFICEGNLATGPQWRAVSVTDNYIVY